MIDIIPLSLLYWHWLVLGFLLIAAETLLPGAFLLWVGIAATIVGFLSAFFIFPMEGQIILFAILSPVCALLGRRLYTIYSKPSDQPGLNCRTYQMVGRLVTLVTPIENGVGRVMIDDTLWRVEGPELPPGVRVRVTGIKNNALVVEQAD